MEGDQATIVATLGRDRVGLKLKNCRRTTLQLLKSAKRGQVKELKEGWWRARRDSNSRPIAPEAIALSN